MVRELSVLIPNQLFQGKKCDGGGLQGFSAGRKIKIVYIPTWNLDLKHIISVLVEWNTKKSADV